MKKSNVPRSTRLSPHTPETGQHPTLSDTLCDCSRTGGDSQHKDWIHNPTYSSGVSSPCLGRGQDIHDDQQLSGLLNSIAGGKLSISVPEMAELLSISKPAAYALARRAGFPAFMVGNRTLVSVPGLMAWVERASAGEGLQ